MRKFTHFIVLFLTILVSYSSSLSQELIMAGSFKGGTYYQFSEDIKHVCTPLLNIKIIETQGALDNIIKVLKGEANIGITQKDALNYVAYFIQKKSKGNVYDIIKVAFPLYEEEIHILSNGKVKTFYDLNNAKVNCGPINSGSCITAELLGYIFNIKMNFVHSSYNEMVEQLKQKMIDAAIIVIGKPAKLFNSISENEGIYLVSIPSNPKLDSLYRRTTIDPTDYKWLKSSIPTYSVRAVLIVRDDKSEYTVNSIGKLTLCLLANKSNLIKHGHPKWRLVNFSLQYTDIGYPISNKLKECCLIIEQFGYTCDGMKMLK